MKKNGKRVTTNQVSAKMFFMTYAILVILTAGQALIYNVFAPNQPIPTTYLYSMLGYWAIVSLIFCLLICYQRYKGYDLPMRKMSEAAKEVAGGDFSVYLEPIHRPNKKDYIDVMFEDFNKMVEELNTIETLKSDFIASVSHEIKTPLSVIQGYAMALQKESLTYQQRIDYTKTIISASEKLTALISNILKLNKLENQEIQIKGEPYDLCRQLCDCALSFEELWEKKHLEMIVDMEDRAIIEADESMLEIVWNNLLSNAIKFSDVGGTITLSQTSDDECILVTIRDTGCGMDQMTMQKMFDKFYQGDTSHSTEGNGLGLALSMKVLELVKGNIKVKSELGIGTTIVVTLPKNPPFNNS